MGSSARGFDRFRALSRPASAAKLFSTIVKPETDQPVVRVVASARSGRASLVVRRSQYDLCAPLALAALRSLASGCTASRKSTNARASKRRGLTDATICIRRRTPTIGDARLRTMSAEADDVKTASASQRRQRCGRGARTSPASTARDDGQRKRGARLITHI